MLDKETTVSALLEAIALFPNIASRLERIERRVTGIEERVSVKSERRKRFYTIKEAAAELNMSVTSARRALKRGLLRKSAGTRKIQIPAESIEAYLSKTEV
jgi:Mg2+ and Co2+ transporter CorA